MIELTKDIIDKCFENCIRQSQYWTNLYRIAFKNWNNIKSIKGFPKVSKETGTYLAQKCIDFDRKHHPEVMSGGLWLNKGFGVDYDLKEDWIIDISGVEVILK